MPVMNKLQILLTAVLTALWLSACTPLTDEAKARSILTSFFSYLDQGRYAEAATLYRGDYNILSEWNPEIDPDDYATLFEMGCTVNGLQCLAVDEINAVEHSAPNVFEFYVQFKNEDGSLYLQESVDALNSGQTPKSVFKFAVVRIADSYYIQDLPPYQP